MRPEVHQSSFARALTDPGAMVPPGIVDPSGNPAPRRFATYRNNVTLSLVESLRSIFPAVEMLVGGAFFRDLALRHVRTRPPLSPILAHYGDGFAEMLAADERLADYPFLADVARLERAWLSAYHAADRPALDAAALVNVAPRRWVDAKFDVHPAARLLPSTHPIVSIWRAARAGTANAGVDQNLAQWALVTRPAFEVSVLAVSANSGPVVASLISGLPLGEALGCAPHPDQVDLAKLMDRLLGAGAFGSVVFSR